VHGYKKVKRGILLALLGFVVLFSAAAFIRSVLRDTGSLGVERPVVVIPARTPGTPDHNRTRDNHYFIAQNAHFDMYFNRASLGFILVDRHNGHVLNSTIQEPVGDRNLPAWVAFMGSGLSVDMYRAGVRMTNRYTMFSDNVRSVITYYADGFAADIFMTFMPEAGEAQIAQTVEIRMEVLLTETGVDVIVPSDSIVDTEGGRIERLAAVFIYPFMGATYGGERPGYMFVPDGSGMLMTLDNHYGRFTTPFHGRVYGNDLGIDVFVQHWVTAQANINPVPTLPVFMPVFGKVYTDTGTGFVGIIKNGQETAEIRAYPNGVSTEYNWVTARFNLRESFIHQTSREGGGGILTFERELKGSDIHVAFTFTTENASYVEMARLYRQHLIENGMLVQQNADFRMGIEFIGAANRQGLFGRRVIPMTTFASAGDYLAYLRARGIGNMNVVFRGWQRGGYDESFPVERVRVENALGGAGGLTDLVNRANNLGGIDFSLHMELGEATQTRRYDSATELVMRLDRNIYNFNDTFFLSPYKMMDVFQRTRDSFVGLNVDRLAVSGMTNHLFTYIFAGRTVSREETRIEMMTIAAEMAEDFHVVMYAPFDYLWRYTSGVTHVPISGSGFTFAHRNIPFMSIVLRGYMPMYSTFVNLNEAPRNFLLQLAETGIMPNFVITTEDNMLLMDTALDRVFTSMFDDWSETIVEYYFALRDLHVHTAYATITSHTLLETNFVRVTYSNGVAVYVNYSNQTRTFGGVTVPPTSFVVTGGTHG